MSYTALYRKFRPQTFEDVKGQEHIVTTLKNQIKSERIGHAYLFCGTRGTGKTTIAKIFARAVNCEDPKDGSPCGECPTCRAILEGSSLNVIEIDAASNNGVDNIREIRDEVAYSPTEGKYKVYIIDEVHMLSIGAFNALLKTLEEPPSYVIFILATTEAHKIPVTILSRCQRYDFKRLPVPVIEDRLKELIRIEGVEAEEKAISYIARKADGAMRDALSLLDECIAFYMDEVLTYDKVLEVLGAVDVEVFSRLLRSIVAQNVLEVIHQLDELILRGADLGQFVTDFTWYMRNLLLLKTSDGIEEVLDISTENQKLLQEEMALVRMDALIRYIRIFSELSGQLRYATQKRVTLEVALIKLCRPQMETDYTSLLQRVRRMEKMLEEGSFTVKGNAGSSKAVLKENGNGPEEEQIQAPVITQRAVPQDLQKVQQMWPSIVSELGGMFRFVLAGGATPEYDRTREDDNTLYIVFHDFMGERYIGNPKAKEELEDAIARRIGKKVSVSFLLREDIQNNGARLAPIKQVEDVLSQFVHTEIEVETDPNV